MQDHAKPIRAALIAGTPEETPMQIKVAAVKHSMGAKLMCHPAYVFTPRHYFNPKLWAKHSVLRPIQLAAKQAGRI